MITKKTLYLLALLTLFGFSFIGIILIETVLDKPFISVFQDGILWYYQLSVGLIYGTITAVLGWQIVNSKLLTSVKQFYGNLIYPLQLKKYEIVFISFCAGVGEEVLFRAAIQPMLGVWLTAIIFVAIHGYLNPLNWRLCIYGIYITLIIAGIGYMFQEIGLISAIAAHFAIDVVLLSTLVKPKK